MRCGAPAPGVVGCFRPEAGLHDRRLQGLTGTLCSSERPLATRLTIDRALPPPLSAGVTMAGKGFMISMFSYDPPYGLGPWQTRSRIAGATRSGWGRGHNCSAMPPRAPVGSRDQQTVATSTFWASLTAVNVSQEASTQGRQKVADWAQTHTDSVCPVKGADSRSSRDRAGRSKEPGRHR